MVYFSDVSKSMMFFNEYKSHTVVDIDITSSNGRFFLLQKILRCFGFVANHIILGPVNLSTILNKM